MYAFGLRHSAGMIADLSRRADEHRAQVLRMVYGPNPGTLAAHSRLRRFCAVSTSTRVTAEEHSIVGGLGRAVAECLGESCPVPLERVGVRDTFTESGPYEDLLRKYGLSSDAIVDATRRAMARKRSAAPIEVQSMCGKTAASSHSAARTQ